MWWCSFWATETMRPERSKTRHRDEAVPWSIAATYRSLKATSPSPRNRAELARHRSGRLAHVGQQFPSRLSCHQQPFRRTEDTHRADREAAAVHDWRRQRHLPRVELADIGGPPTLSGADQFGVEALLVRGRVRKSV